MAKKTLFDDVKDIEEEEEIEVEEKEEIPLHEDMNDEDNV